MSPFENLQRGQLDTEDLGDLPMDSTISNENSGSNVRLQGTTDMGRVPDGMQMRHEDDEEGGEADDGDGDEPENGDRTSKNNANSDANGKKQNAEEEGEDEDDEEDEDEDEEDDDDEEDEDEEEAGNEGNARPRKKKRRFRGNKYVDLEVEVDESEDEEDEEAGEAGFEVADNYLDRPGRRQVQIADSFEGDSEDLAQNNRDHRQLERRARDKEEKEALRIAREYKERHRQRRQGMGIAAMQDFAPRSVLMPGVDDPSIWRVKCKIGRERELVMSISRKAIIQNLSITSAFQRDSFHGHLYVEARSEGHVREAVTGLVGIYLSTAFSLVPIEEMPDLLKSRRKETPLAIGGWVRIKRGTYKGDLAQVEDVPETTDYVTLKVVPRIDLHPKEDAATGDNKKRRRQDLSLFRAPPKFFNAEEVRGAYTNKAKVQKDAEGWHFAGELYANGYLIKDFKMHMVDRENVQPTIDEITRFVGETAATGDGATGGIGGVGGAGEVGGSRLDLNLIADAAKAQTVLQPGDYIEIFEGSQKGIIGTIDSISNNIIHISPSEPSDLQGTTIEVLAHQVRKRFKAGDHVKVLRGKNVNESGLVLKIKDDLVTFLSDLSVQEVTVFSKDIREAAEVGTGAAAYGQYEQHDLVQLDSETVGCIFKIEPDAFRVVDQTGAIRLLRPSQIKNKLDTRRSVATDYQNLELRAGDLVKEIIQGSNREPRQGRVLHVYRSLFAFLHNRDIVENGGVFVTHARQLGSQAPRAVTSGGANGGVADLTRMNPEMQAGLNAFSPAAQSGLLGGAGAPPPTRGRSLAIGAHVTIIKGPHKGYKGICKDMNGPLARVELHTNNKTLTIERMKLGAMGDQGTLISLDDWEKEKASRGRGGGGGGGGGGGFRASSYGGTSTNSTPLSVRSPSRPSESPGNFGGGRTPMYAMGKTPMYAGGKTPMPGGFGGATPYSGGKTPAYGGDAFAASSRTPYAASGSNAFSASSRTPYAGGAGGGGGGAWGGSTPYGGAAAGSNGPGAGAAGTSSAWGASASPAYRPNNAGPGAAAAANSAWGSASPVYNPNANNSATSSYSNNRPPPVNNNSAWGSTSPVYDARNSSSFSAGPGPGGNSRPISAPSPWESEQPVNTPYASAPTPAAQTPYPSAPTPAPAGDAWDSYDSAPTPAANHQTPYAAAATPAADNDAWD